MVGRGEEFEIQMMESVVGKCWRPHRLTSSLNGGGFIFSPTKGERMGGCVVCWRRRRREIKQRKPFDAHGLIEESRGKW